jgi:hypothetical protein
VIFTPEDRLKFLEFEKQNDEKYSAFIKKPTIGVALGFYNSLLKYIPGHQWLRTDLKSAINSVNVIRNTQVHAGKKAVWHLVKYKMPLLTFHNSEAGSFEDLHWFVRTDPKIG